MIHTLNHPIAIGSLSLPAMPKECLNSVPAASGT
jgi:hypothetical protein